MIKVGIHSRRKFEYVNGEAYHKKLFVYSTKLVQVKFNIDEPVYKSTISCFVLYKSKKNNKRRPSLE